MTLSISDMQTRILSEREDLTARLLVASQSETREVAISEVHRRTQIFREVNSATVRTVGDPVIVALRSVLDDVMAGRL